MVTKITFNSELKNLWKEILQSNNLHAPFLTYDWFDTWHTTAGKDLEPFILTVNNTTLAPFARIGADLHLSGGEEGADYLDIIGPDQQKQTVWPEILTFLKTEGITSIRLGNIPQDSSTLLFFQSHASSVIKEEDTTPYVSLPNTWEEYLQLLDKKNKHELERKIRKFERENPTFNMSESTNVVTDADILLSLMKRDPAKNTFLTSQMEEFFRAIIQRFEKNIILTILRVDDTPVAATMAFKWEDTLLLYNSGFDETHSGAGFYIKATNIQRAIASGYTEYNFLQGRERYKYELGAKDFLVYRIDVTL